MPIDAATFRRFQSGDEVAAMAVVEEYQARLIGYLVVQTGDRDLAEDIAQEAFLEAYRQRRRIRSEKAVKSWLFTVAARTARRVKHTGLQYYGNEDAMAREPSQNPKAPEKLSMIQLNTHLRAAIAKLPAAENQLVLLRYFGGLSIKELAEALDMPMGTVGVKLGRALAKLRRELEQQGLKPGDFLT